MKIWFAAFACKSQVGLFFGPNRTLLPGLQGTGVSQAQRIRILLATSEGLKPMKTTVCSGREPSDLVKVKASSP